MFSYVLVKLADLLQIKNAVHILLIQLFNCNRCKVRIIMWFNCFNSSHQLNDHIFLSRPSITHRSEIPTFLFIIFHRCFYLPLWTSFTAVKTLSLFMNFYLAYSFFFTILTDFYNPSFRFNVTVCARNVSVSAPIIQLRTSLRACTHTRPGSRAYA